MILYISLICTYWNEIVLIREKGELNSLGLTWSTLSGLNELDNPIYKPNT
jgi:hypothetical protein